MRANVRAWSVRASERARRNKERERVEEGREGRWTLNPKVTDMRFKFRGSSEIKSSVKLVNR